MIQCGVLSSSSRRGPGSISAMGIGLRRCDGIFMSALVRLCPMNLVNESEHQSCAATIREELEFFMTKAMDVDRETLRVAPSLELAVTYRREVDAGIERIWENVFDWEHLPVLHEMYFNAVELLDIGCWGWQVALTKSPGTQDRRMILELRADQENARYRVQTLAGDGAGTLPSGQCERHRCAAAALGGGRRALVGGDGRRHTAGAPGGIPPAARRARDRAGCV